jgi:hypothetical protein
MFESVFWEYKNDIRKNFPLRGENTIIDWVIFGAIMLMGVGIPLLMHLSLWGWASFFTVIMVLGIPPLDYYWKYKFIKTRHFKLNEFLEKRIVPIENLLNREDRNLYNEKSIDWLIECCDYFSGNKTESPQVISSFKSLIPVFTLILGAVLARMEWQGLIAIGAVTYVCGMVTIAYVLVKNAIFSTNNQLIRDFKAELKYIRTLLPNKRKEVL